jgi:hypothetical protein
MGLESATYISQLVDTYPTGADNKNQGDNHLRMIKAVLQAQFPNLTAAAITATVVELNHVDGVTSSIQTQLDSGQTQINGKAALAGSTGQSFSIASAGTSESKAIRRSNYATNAIGGTIKMRVAGNNLYITNNGNNA